MGMTYNNKRFGTRLKPKSENKVKKTEKNNKSKLNSIPMALRLPTHFQKSVGTTSKTVGRCGGIIALRSRSNIVNDGMLTSNGSSGSGHGGGSICLCADNAVINHGEIECRADPMYES